MLRLVLPFLLVLSSCWSARPPAGDVELQQLLDLIASDYVRDVPRAELTAVARDAVLAELDPYSDYLSPAEFAPLTDSLSGAMAGVGARVEVDPELTRFRVRGPFRASPALAAGVRAGDLLEAVDGRALAGRALDDVMTSMRGAAGSRVELTLRTGNEPARTIALQRERIELPSVRGLQTLADGSPDHRVEGAPGIAYVRIMQFTNSTPGEVGAALDTIAAAGARGVVLDLRQNPGGGLASAIAVADLFLDGGRIVSLRARGRPEEGVDATPGVRSALPLVVLVDERTMSAAEILAACLQDRARAAVLGARSYGKGTVQRLFPTADGGAFKLTIEHYVRPSGRAIERHLPGTDSAVGGVWPDAGLALELTPAEAEQLAAELYRRDSDAGLVGVASEEDAPPIVDQALARACELLLGEPQAAR